MPGNQQQAQKSAADIRREKAKLLKSKRLKARKYRVKEVVNLDTASSVANYVVKEVQMKTSSKSALDLANTGLMKQNSDAIGAATARASEAFSKDVNRQLSLALGASEVAGALGQQGLADLASGIAKIDAGALAMAKAGISAVSSADAQQRADTAAGINSMTAGFANAAAAETEAAKNQVANIEADADAAKAASNAEAKRALANIGKLDDVAKAAFGEFKKDFDTAFSKLKDMFTSWKNLDFKALANAFRGHLNAMMRLIKPCPGEEIYKIYWCPKHMVFCEKALDSSGARTNSCYTGVPGVHFATGQAVADMPMAALCCENKEKSWSDGWANQDETNSTKTYQIFEWPALVCTAFLKKGLTFSSIVFDNDKSQVTRKANSGKDSKFISPEVRAELMKTGVMKLFFIGKSSVRKSLIGDSYEEMNEDNNDFIDNEDKSDDLIHNIQFIINDEHMDYKEKLKALKDFKTDNFPEEDDDDDDDDDTEITEEIFDQYAQELIAFVQEKHFEKYDPYDKNFRKAVAVLISGTIEEEGRKRLMPGYCEQNVPKK